MIHRVKMVVFYIYSLQPTGYLHNYTYLHDKQLGLSTDRVANAIVMIVLVYFLRSLQFG